MLYFWPIYTGNFYGPEFIFLMGLLGISTKLKSWYDGKEKETDITFDQKTDILI